MKRTTNRNRLWVDPPFQARLLSRIALYVLLYGAVVFHVGFLFQCLMQIAANGPTRNLGTMYVEFLGQQRALVIAFAITLPIMLWDVLKFSHRVAGPLVRCRRVMTDMTAGRPVAPFVPRKGDLLKELFQAFNDLIARWNSRSNPDVMTEGVAGAETARPVEAEAVRPQS